MMQYRLKDRLKEISTHMGLILLILATYLGWHASPEDPTKIIAPLLQMFGSFGIAMPEKDASAREQQIVTMILEEMKKAGAIKAFIIFCLIGLWLASSLVACASVQQFEQDAQVACQSYAQTSNQVVAPPGSAAAVTKGYVDGACDIATGQLTAAGVANLDPNTAAWISLGEGVLKAALTIPAPTPLAPASAPAKT